MLLALLLAIPLLCLYGMKISVKGYHEDFLSKDKTNSIKGIFILLIVLKHSLPYINASAYAFNGFGDVAVDWFVYRFSQLVVVMFLFYSGYGVGESFKRKGDGYVKSMPRHRILATLLNFDVAVIVFILLGLALGHPIDIRHALLSLTGWEDVGNSNWYIFVILLCYLFTYVSLRCKFPGRGYSIGLIFVLCFVAIVVLSQYKKDCWYNTILCYPLGFLFSTYKELIISWFKKSYWLIGATFFILFAAFYCCPSDSLKLTYNAMSMAFVLLFVLLTMKVGINNPPLRWLGKNLFPMYIYMHVPMLLMSEKFPFIVGNWPAMFVIISLVVTLVIAYFYRFWQIKLN